MERRSTCPTAHRVTALRVLVLALLAGALAVAAHADYYTVTLTNGTSFQTLYRPVPAEWDDNVVMIATDLGNWIGLYVDEIADVSSHAEATGFGYQLDTTTLFVGWSPNDAGDGEDGEESAKEAGPDLEAMFPEPAASNVLEQFVDIPVAGGTVAGQPIDGN